MSISCWFMNSNPVCHHSMNQLPTRISYFPERKKLTHSPFVVKAKGNFLSAMQFGLQFLAIAEFESIRSTK